MGLISDGTTIFDAGAMSLGGSMVFIKKLTASSSGTLSFVNGASGVVLDGTYKEYLFTFKDIHPATDSVNFLVNFSIDGGTNYNVAKTTTFFYAYNNESNGIESLEYNQGNDLAQGTGFQKIIENVGNDNDQCGTGFMNLYDPSSTAFVKHFTTNMQWYNDSEYSQNAYVAGYANTTSAVNAVQFVLESGNIDVGDICLYGIN
tara:strand:+ start:130 stop:738 length:609 start_codon:yes stop_codon:yes gene_type:complete